MEYSNYSECAKYYKLYNSKEELSREFTQYSFEIEKRFHNDTLVYKTSFTLNGKLHNIFGTAFIVKYEKNITKCWWIHGELHNIRGPALLGITNDIIYRTDYYIRGIYFTHSSFLSLRIEFKNDLYIYKYTVVNGKYIGYYILQRGPI